MKKGHSYTKFQLTKLSKIGLLSGQCSKKLTPAEREVLFFLVEEFLTPKQISIRRQCTLQAVSNIISSLKKKGAFDLAKNLVYQNLGTGKPSKLNIHQIRLHGEQFHITIIYETPKYKKILRVCNNLNVDGNTVRIFRNCIDVYSGQVFWGNDAEKATYNSISYWNRVFKRLEHELGVIILKARAQNIKRVKAEYAEVNNNLAKEIEPSREKIRIYSNDDGKLAFLLDNSFNLHEFETVHPKTSEQDMQQVAAPFFNDLRDYYQENGQSLKMSDLVYLLKEVIAQNKETAAGLNAITQVIKAQFTYPEKQEEQKQNIDYVG